MYQYVFPLQNTGVTIPPSAEHRYHIDIVQEAIRYEPFILWTINKIFSNKMISNTASR